MRYLLRLFFVIFALSFLLTTYFVIAQNDPASDVIATGDVLMDVEFRAARDGFGFRNYGNEEGYLNLTPIEIVRLFGEQVCYTEVNKSGECELIPNAQLWMEEFNAYMAGGHCEGMAVLSTLFFTGIKDPADFGAERVRDLELVDNPDLQREIAYWWSLQGVSPIPDRGISGSPAAVVLALIDGFASDEELYTIGIYRADGTGGHAITPYAVVDMGDNIYRILVYDNNYPLEERFIEVNANDDTWVYTGSMNPKESESGYSGDAQTQNLVIYPIAARLEQPVCPFCDEAENTSLSLNGYGYMVVTDAQGHQTGFVNGAYVNNIPGASIRYPHNLDGANRAPVIIMPRNSDFTISITADPQRPNSTQFSITQAGKIAHLSGFILSNQPHTLKVDNHAIRYTAPQTQNITFKQGITTGNGTNLLYTLSGTGADLNFAVDTQTGDFDVSGGADTATFSLSVEYIDADGNSEEFEAMDISLDDDEEHFSPDDWEDEIISEEEDGVEDEGFDEDYDEIDDAEFDEDYDEIDDAGFDEDYDEADEFDTGDGGGEEGGE